MERVQLVTQLQKDMLDFIAMIPSELNRLNYELEMLEEKLNETSEVMDQFTQRLDVLETKVPLPETPSTTLWRYLLTEWDGEEWMKTAWHTYIMTPLRHSFLTLFPPKPHRT